MLKCTLERRICMLHLEKLIGEGASRVCYQHPEDAGKCVKIAKDAKELNSLKREIMITTLLKPILGSCIPSCDDAFAETDKGPGMVCELVRNYDGTVSPPVRDRKAVAALGYTPADYAPTLNLFIEKIIRNDIFFYDFNVLNFVFQVFAPGKARVVFIDLKSLNRNGYWGFLRLDRFIAPLARIVMFRRIRRFYGNFDLAFPFDSLCREKMFDGFLVRFRPSLRSWERRQNNKKRS